MFAHICSIWPINGTLSGATTPGQNGLGRNGNKVEVNICQISKAGASPSDCLVSYPGQLLGEVLHLCRDVIGVFYSPSQSG